MVDCAIRVAVLFARADSVYKTLADVEVFDASRDARTYDGPWPVVAHPPCRAWGLLRHFAKPRADERNLARLAVSLVRRFGGVLEHPAGSSLWKDQLLPRPGEARDRYGGWTLPIVQHWWGHKAEKATWLYICGVEPSVIPAMPLVLGTASHVIAQHRTLPGGGRVTRGHPKWRPEVTKADREHTPPNLAGWLVNLAARCKRVD